MKKLLLTTMFTALAASSASAIDIPRGIFRTSETESARTEAAEDEVAIAYVMFPEAIKPSWPTCTGTVSSTVLKELKGMKSYTRVVFVDQKERNSMPKEVQSALTKAGGAMPLLVFMTPDHKKTLGTFNHAKLKNQEYSDIFRNVKKTIRTAKKEGEFKNAGASSANAETSDNQEVASSNGAVMIAKPMTRIWTSAKGKKIKAKLIKFENATYYLKTTNGRTVEITAADLNPDSAKLAEELVASNK